LPDHFGAFKYPSGAGNVHRPSLAVNGRGDDKNSARLKVLETMCERLAAHVE
jgi:hypothetical protein